MEIIVERPNVYLTDNQKKEGTNTRMTVQRARYINILAEGSGPLIRS